MAKSQTILLYRWYGNLSACVKWNDKYSKMFEVASGTKQFM